MNNHQKFEIFQQFMTMMGGGMPPGMQAAIPSAMKNVGGNSEMHWKEHLHNTLMKKSGGTVDEKPAYEVVEDENRKYNGTVTMEGQSYTSETPAPSKKAAEHAAAKAAMKAKFPAEFEKIFMQGAIPSAMKKVGGNSEMRWKEHLHNTLMKKSGGTVDEKPVYEVVEDVNRKYNGTVTVGGQSYTSGKPALSKKAAEHAAAKAAMKALYSPEFEKLSQEADFESMMQGPMGQGQKRKAGTDQVQEQSPKNKLLDSMQLLVSKNHQRNLTKDDIEWAFEELEGEQKTYKCIVTITDKIGAEGGKTFTGEVCDSKKKAEASAAHIAYDNMKDILSPLEEANQAKKRQKKEESMEAFKARKAAKVAAKEAVKEAAKA